MQSASALTGLSFRHSGSGPDPLIRADDLDRFCYGAMQAVQVARVGRRRPGWASVATINALRISVMVAGALYNQNIVLKKIQMLNDITNSFIISNAQMLKVQGVEIQKQAMEANISVETLKIAFADAMEALDSISTYKQEALPQMRDTINQFKELAAKGEEQIQQLEKGHKLAL